MSVLMIAASMLVLSQPSAVGTAGVYRGPLAPAAPITLYISLPGQHAEQIDRLILAQNTPGSPAYGRYLTPQQYGAYFGAAPQAYASAIAGLRAHGFAIVDLPANHRDIVVSAPASVVERTFATPLDLRERAGHLFYANRFAPSVPEWLHGGAVVGLDTYPAFHSEARQGSPQVRIGSSVGWGAPDIQNVYDLTPIYTKYDGKGVTIGEATVGAASQSDFAAFNRHFGLHATMTTVALGSANYSDRHESTLDVEWMAAVAPRANVLQVALTYNTNAGFTRLYSYFVNKRSDVNIVSTSWGNCEQQMQSYGSTLTAEENLMAQASTEGQWWLSAAGDYGSDDCEDGKTVSVDYPGSSPYVVSVGGTEVTPASTAGGVYTGWKKEVTWDTPGSYSGAGGGGKSILYNKPVFQNALTPHDGRRDVPDVALMADWNDVNGAYFMYYDGKWLSQWGGTSFAAPEWAAYLALIQSRYGSKKIASPLVRLYALAEPARYHALFHDITRGCNGLDGVPGFCAHAGYDQATGLGSFIGDPLLKAY